jgi:hypothetical protein
MQYSHKIPRFRKKKKDIFHVGHANLVNAAPLLFPATIKARFPVLVNLLGNTDDISVVVSATVGVNKCRSAVRPLGTNSCLSGVTGDVC